MIQIIKHRCNKIEDLASVEKNWGVEIDLRSDVQKNGFLHLQHDPWVQGVDFNLWLDAYEAKGIQGPIILNTKEDGLESEIFKTLDKYKIENYFFLDTTLPSLYKWTRTQNKKQFAVRWSVVEPLEFTLLHAGFCDWVWVDCFGCEPPPIQVIERLSKDFKVCLVSPELQNINFKDFNKFEDLKKSPIHAVCTKQPQSWRSWVV